MDENKSLTRIDGLNEVEMLVLKAMRHWVGALSSPKGSETVWRHGSALQPIFCRLGGKQAAYHFDRFLGYLAKNALRQIDINCHCCREISMDELRLLRVFSCLQSSRQKLAKNQMNSFLKSDQMVEALPYALKFVEHMSDARQFLSNYSISIGTRDFNAADLMAMSYSKTIH